MNLHEYSEIVCSWKEELEEKEKTIQHLAAECMKLREEKMSKWISIEKWEKINQHTPTDTRIVVCDEQGWCWISMLKTNGKFEDDNGSEPGLFPIGWMPLPEAPEGK